MNQMNNEKTELRILFARLCALGVRALLDDDRAQAMKYIARAAKLIPTLEAENERSAA